MPTLILFPRTGRLLASPSERLCSFGPAQLITAWFQGLLTPHQGYFSTFSHDTNCAIGLRMYLGLGDSVSHIHTGFPTHATRAHRWALPCCTYGAFTLFGLPFQKSSVSTDRHRYAGAIHHISFPLLERIQFALFRVRSPLITESLLLSSPPLTKMFQFRGLPLHKGVRTSSREVPFGDLRF